MENYYIIPQTIVDQYQNYVKGNVGIHFTQINTLEWVINTECLIEVFTEIPWNTFEIRELTNADFEPNYTLPDLGNEAFIIPSEYQWLFPLDVNGFIVPIYDYEVTQKILYKSHRDWTAMREMLDSTELVLLKKAITPFLSFADSATIITV
jgi:hypothetical protein